MSLWNRVWLFIDNNQGRLAGIAALVAEIGAGIWNAHLHQPVDLASFGAGLAGILTASAAAPAARAALAYHQRRLAQAEAENKQ